MKLLHITFSLEEGGVDTFLLELLPLLRRHIDTIDVLVLSKGRERLGNILEANDIGIIQGKYVNIYNPLNIGYIRKFLRNYDIVHSHLFPVQYFVVFASFFLKKRPYLVTTEHCTTNRRRQRSYLRLLEKFVYGKYDRVVGVSNQAVKNLSDWLGKSDNIVAIPNGINLSRIFCADSYQRTTFNFKESDILLMMVARFFSQKDHATVIRALTHLSYKYKLLFVGSGELMEQCRSLTFELNLNDRIMFLGNRNDVPSLIKMVDIGILSTNFEGLPISVLEFMAAGKPIIGSDVDGLRELVGHKSLLFPIGDECALAKCIERLSDPNLIKIVGEEMYNKSFLYSIDNTAVCYYNMYKKMIKFEG